MKRRVLGLLMLSSMGTGQLHAADHRLSADEVGDWPHMYEALEATALIASKGAIAEQSAEGLHIYSRTLGERFNFCPNEKFASEPSVVGACTGVLVGADVVITSPECIKGPIDCEEKVFVFGFNHSESDLNHIHSSDVYSCKYTTGNLGNSVDGRFSIVRLDREVEGRTPLRVANKMPSVGDTVALVAHPHGLSAKVSISEVFEVKERNNLFRAGLSAIKGSEGGAVIALDSGEVVGVHQGNLNSHVRVNPYRGCAETRICSGEDCFLEYLVPASLFADAVEGWNNDPDMVRLRK